MAKIKILTPIHIGTGEKLGKLDLVFTENKLFVIDINKVIEKVKNSPSALKEFENPNFNIKNFLGDQGINYSDVAKYEILTNLKPNRSEIFEFIKTGLGNPIIPGSSIKGAIRTVFLWHLVKEYPEIVKEKLQEIIKDNKMKKERADDIIDKQLFGENPNYNFMRVLQISDAKFKILDLSVEEVKILDKKNNGTYGWWRYKASIKDNPKFATSTFIEVLKEGAFSEFNIKIEEFLLQQPIVESLKFNNKKVYFSELVEKCNEYAKNYIQGEIEFYKNCGMTNLQSFYENLHKNIPENNRIFLLHLGWGIGWNAITGNWFEEEKEDFRRKYKLGKGYWDKVKKQWVPINEFPKTRKIVFKNIQPYRAMGWVKVEI